MQIGSEKKHACLETVNAKKPVVPVIPEIFYRESCVYTQIPATSLPEWRGGDEVMGGRAINNPAEKQSLIYTVWVVTLLKIVLTETLGDDLASTWVTKLKVHVEYVGSSRKTDWQNDSCKR